MWGLWTDLEESIRNAQEIKNLFLCVEILHQVDGLVIQNLELRRVYVQQSAGVLASLWETTDVLGTWKNETDEAHPMARERKHFQMACFEDPEMGVLTS